MATFHHLERRESERGGGGPEKREGKKTNKYKYDKYELNRIIEWVMLMRTDRHSSPLLPHLTEFSHGVSLRFL